MPNSSIWFDLYRKRYKWAVDAYDSFVNDLAPELVDALQRNKKVTIAVYGATQVGKTTLILDLLGLQTLTSDEASRVLRGGQQLGKSATALPIRYERSLDDGWHIDGDGPLSADAACEKLGKFRKSVELGEILDADVLSIQIPQRLFLKKDQDEKSFDLNIIDIPGINSRSDKERELTEQLARRYVTVADVVLLVGRADSLGFLNQQDLQIEALAEWAAQPARFRIVLTFGFSPDSLRRKFMLPHMTVEKIRNILLEEVRTHDYQFPLEFMENLFLLELGDSMADLQRSNPDYCQEITRLTSEFRGMLLTNIQRAAGPYARLHGAFQLDRVIRARIERLESGFRRLEEAFDRDEKEVVKSLAAHRADLADADVVAIKSAIGLLEQEVSVAHGKCSELKLGVKKLSDFDCSTFYTVKLSDAVVENVSWLQSELQRCELEQRKQCKLLASLLVSSGIVPEWCADCIETIGYQRTALMDLESKLDGYALDKYWRSNVFYSDRDSLDRALKEAAKANGDGFKVMALRNMEEMNEIYIKGCKNLERHKTILNSYVEKLEAITIFRQGALAELNKKKQAMEDSLGLAGKFESEINKSFLNELLSCQEEIKIHPVPSRRFFSLLQGRLLLNEVDKLYEGKPFDK